MAIINGDDIIKHYQLEPHREGGYSRVMYTDAVNILQLQEKGLEEEAELNDFTKRVIFPRPISSSIYFLLKEKQSTRLHRLSCDELWFYHGGGDLTIVELNPSTSLLEKTTLGPISTQNAKQFHVVPANSWFGAKCES